MIKIFKDDIQLPLVAETLTLTSKNSVFSDSFSMDYSKNPFLILENYETEAALGSRNIMSLQKQPTYNITVFKENKVYFGKLKVKSYGLGVRKCDVVFGSEIIKILDKPLSDFMPTVYMDENNKIPYTETTDVEIPQNNLLANLLLHEKKSYPEVDFQFPEIYAPDWFGDNPDDWHETVSVAYSEGGVTAYRDKEIKKYTDFLNKRKSNLIKISKIYNQNVVSPKPLNYTSFHPVVFVESILKYVFKSVDWRVNYSNYCSVIFKQLLIFNSKSNNTLLDLGKTKKYTKYSWFEIPSNELGKGSYEVRFKVTFDTEQNECDVFEPELNIKCGGVVFFSDKVYGNPHKDVWTGSFYCDLDDLDTIDVFFVGVIYVYDSSNTHLDRMNDSYSECVLEISPKISKNKVLFHPTVDLSRHVPDWTVAEFLTNFKNLFNLKIDLNDTSKQLEIDFTDTYLKTHDMVDLSHYKLEEKMYENNQSDAFKISYTNEESAYIDVTGVVDKPINETFVEINNSFYTPEFNGSHHEIKKDDADSVALLFNRAGTPNTTYEIDNFNLNLATNNGVGNTCWKSWVNFRQLASRKIFVGKIAKKDIIQIERFKKIYYQNVVFLVETITTKETNGFTETTLKVHSKMF